MPIVITPAPGRPRRLVPSRRADGQVSTPVLVAEPAASVASTGQVNEAPRVTSSSVAPAGPAVRVSLPAGCTVADLRAALRRMNGADRITDVVLTNEYGAVWLDPLTGFTLTVEPERTRPGT